jgi:predicted nucleic acid-binding protein
VIVDASVVLSAFFPDERQPQAQGLIRDHVSGRVQLLAPTLLLYETTNAVLHATRRGRIAESQGEAILTSFDGLGIELRSVTWQRMWPLAQRYDRSAYDAAYLALGEATGDRLITGDGRLYRAVRDHLTWVVWLGDYRGPAEAAAVGP